MNGVEIPEYFLCPISLQIMKDPVTTITGITYDRLSIEQWLLTSATSSCPVTNQPLARDSVLTPNHTLRRLTQCWCTLNSVDRIPTPQPLIARSHVTKLLRHLNSPSDHPDFTASLKKLESISTSSDSNRKSLAESGVATAMVHLLIRLCREEKTLVGVQETLRTLYHLLTPTAETIDIISRSDIVDSVTWVLTAADDVMVRVHALMLMRKISEVSGSSVMERLDSGFFKAMVGTIAKEDLPPKAIKAGLYVLNVAAQWARNRILMITDARSVHALIEFEIGAWPDYEKSRKARELGFGLLAQLCTCADGRERFLGHVAGVAMVTKRLLRVSPAVDYAAVQILAAVARYSGAAEVVAEMLNVGAVAKLCMVLQADCDKELKDKAREVLRSHHGEWNNSPCIQMYLITRYPTVKF